MNRSTEEIRKGFIMIFKMLQVEPLQVNCYIVADEKTREAAVFDPGGSVNAILEVINNENLKVKYIINTHTHWDHTGGNKDLQDATGAPIITHRDEASALGETSERAAQFGSFAPDSEASQFVEEGDIIEVGSLEFKVVDLRGHSPAGLGFVFEGDLEIDGIMDTRTFVICGDALFAGSIGRTDFPGGDMQLLLDNIRNKIFTLPDDTFVLPGHGPVSTVEHEKSNNPFFRS
jgi:glyoxylase-like metal-dependent hydrolase (beta-lactamase superfamily II)